MILDPISAHEWTRENWKNKKTIVFGIGASGISALKLLRYLGANVGIVNRGEVTSWQNTVLPLGFSSSQLYAEENAAAIMEQADLIVLSPGIPRSHPQMQRALERGVPVWSEIELAYHWIKKIENTAPIIAITGTNGKTTTVSMVAHLLQSLGKKAFIGGNIGIPFSDAALQLLERRIVYDVICLELSSFQLESIDSFRPNVAAILNISLNHGERYKTLPEYALAKFQMAKFMQKGDVILVPQIEFSNWPESEILVRSQCTLKELKVEDAKEEVSKNFGKTEVDLGGMHNWKNLLFALFCVKEVFSPEEINLDALKTFHFYPYRIQKIEGRQPFQAFNDAKATNWDATLNAVKNFKDISSDVILITGGQWRHEAKTLAIPEEFKKIVKKIYLIGETADTLYENFSKSILTQKSYTLEKTIELIMKDNFTGILLFSPGFQSFDQFKNYQHRGETFTNLIKNL